MQHANRLHLHYYSKYGFNSTRQAVMCFALTYYVYTEGSEGMSPTHVEMSRVEPLEEADVIKTLRLQEEEKARKDIMARERISIHRGEPYTKKDEKERTKEEN